MGMYDSNDDSFLGRFLAMVIFGAIIAAIYFILHWLGVVDLPKSPTK